MDDLLISEPTEESILWEFNDLISHVESMECTVPDDLPPSMKY